MKLVAGVCSSFPATCPILRGRFGVIVGTVLVCLPMSNPTLSAQRTDQRSESVTGNGVVDGMPPTTYLLGIGIDKYVDPSWSSLTGAVNDVHNIRTVLDTLYHVQVIDSMLLTDSIATRDNILHLIKGVVKDTAKAGANAILYFAGHGIVLDNVRNEVFLIPHDGHGIPDDEGSLRNLAKSPGEYGSDYKWIRLGRILDDFGESTLTQVLIIVDACYAGNVGGITQYGYYIMGQSPAGDPLEPHKRRIREIFTGTGVDRRAVEDQGEGLFTHHLRVQLASAGEKGGERIRSDEIMKPIVDSLEAKQKSAHAYFAANNVVRGEGEDKSLYRARFHFWLKPNEERAKRHAEMKVDSLWQMDSLWQTAADKLHDRLLDEELFGDCPSWGLESVQAIDDTQRVRKWLVDVVCTETEVDLPKYLCKTLVNLSEESSLIRPLMWKEIEGRYRERYQKQLVTFPILETMMEDESCWNGD